MDSIEGPFPVQLLKMSDPDAKRFRFDDPRQARIFERLNRLVGEGPAAFYRDACRLMTGEDRYESTSHLVAHLLREVESALRDVLEPVAGRPSGHSSENQKSEIQAILKALEIPESDALAVAWLSLAGRQADTALHRRAHRDSLARPRPLDGDFCHWWTQIESVLDVVLGKLESKFLLYQRILDGLLSKPMPTQHDLDMLKNHVPNSLIVRSYFFDRLDKPEWMEPLASNGFFKDPPELVRDEKGVAIPRWPASGYLKRMAPKSPELVMRIIEKVPETGNTRVHEDFADAALDDGMPAALAARWAGKEAKWVSRQDYLYFGLPRKIGQVFSRLAKEGECGVALDLAEALLTILPGPQKTPNSSGGETWALPPEPRARFDLWEYEQILKNNVPDLLPGVGKETLGLLCDLLQKAIEVSQPDGTANPDDLPYIWRPAIEDHGQNLNLGVKPMLVTALRDTADVLARREPHRLAEVVDQLEQRGQSWLIFRRIVLHLLRVIPESTPQLVAKRLLDRALFDEVGVRHEYLLLMKERFGMLARNEQETILGWIDKGPDVPDLKARLEGFAGRPVANDEVESYRENWRRERLEPIAPYLEGDWKVRYDALSREMPVPRHPEFPVYTTGGAFGPSSPKTFDELKVMSARELAGYLREWQPTARDPFHGATPEGLGRQVTSLVSANPQKYAAEANLFALDEPTYVRSILWGFRDAQAQGRLFEWGKVLGLCNWVVREPREIPDRQPGPLDVLDRDPNWAEARKTVIWLISEGLEKESNMISFDLRGQVWEAIEPVTRDPNPTPEDDELYLFGGLKQKYEGTRLKVRNLDVLSYSINTVRGEAMHTVVRYALWLRRNLEKQPGAKELIEKRFDFMPEVRRVLDERLDVRREPSLAIRAVYGRAYPWLYQLDPGWARGAVSRIFPAGHELASHWEAAWEAYMASWPAYDEIADVLREQYKAAVERIGSSPEKLERIVNLDERLAGHLMTLYWRGKMEYDSDLLAGFYAKANAEIRACAMNFIGRGLYQEKGEISAETLDRLKLFWKMRLQTAQAGRAEEFTEEFAQFGWWFICRKLEDEWAMEQLVSALRISKSSQPEHLVVGRLAELSDKMPNRAIECLSLIVEGDKQGWGILGWQEDAKKTIKRALESSDAAARQSAFDLANRLGSLGHFGFVELLKLGKQ